MHHILLRVSYLYFVTSDSCILEISEVKRQKWPVQTPSIKSKLERSYYLHYYYYYYIIYIIYNCQPIRQRERNSASGFVDIFL